MPQGFSSSWDYNYVNFMSMFDVLLSPCHKGLLLWTMLVWCVVFSLVTQVLQFSIFPPSKMNMQEKCCVFVNKECSKNCVEFKGSLVWVLVFLHWNVCVNVCSCGLPALVHYLDFIVITTRDKQWLDVMEVNTSYWTYTMNENKIITWIK